LTVLHQAIYGVSICVNQSKRFGYYNMHRWNRVFELDWQVW